MKKINSKIYINLFALLFFFFTATSQAKENAVLIDVRTQSEWNEGHLKDAILIPYDIISNKASSTLKNKNQKINVYCQSGRRAEIARQTLIKLGYTNVNNIGGFEALKAKGYEVSEN